MKNNIIKNVKLIKMATVAVFFVSMAFNVAMVSSSPATGKSSLSLSSLKAMVFANGEGIGGGGCTSDFDCPYNQICLQLPGMYGHCSGSGMCQTSSDCTYPQTCYAGMCMGGGTCLGPGFGDCDYGQMCEPMPSGEHDRCQG